MPICIESSGDVLHRAQVSPIDPPAQSIDICRLASRHDCNARESFGVSEVDDALTGDCQGLHLRSEIRRVKERGRLLAIIGVESLAVEVASTLRNLGGSSARSLSTVGAFPTEHP